MIKKTLFLQFVFLLLLSGNNYAQRQLDLSQYKVVWYDEFDYPSMSAMVGGSNPKWNYRDYDTPCLHENNVPIAYRTFEDMTVSNGILTLRSMQKTDTVACDRLGQTNTILDKSMNSLWSNFDEDYPCYKPWGTGNADTIKGFNYGIFEIRCQLSNGNDDNSNFWLYNPSTWQCSDDYPACPLPPMEGVSPYEWQEVDVFENNHGAQGNTFFSTIHKNGMYGCNRDYCATFHKFDFDPTQSFHTYTLAWTPNSVTWFVDGVEYRTINGELFKGKMRVIVDMLHRGSGNGGEYKVDYVRVYRPNNYPVTGGSGFIWNSYSSTARKNYIANNPWPSYMSNGWNETVATNSPVEVSSTAIMNSVSYGSYFYYKVGNNLNHAQINPNGSISFSPTISTNVASDATLTADELSSKVFYKGTDNDIWTYYYSGQWGLTKLDQNNLFSDNVAGNVVVDKNLSRVYYTDSQNVLWYFEWSSLDNSWHRHKTNISIIKGSIAIDSQGKIYFRGTDDNIWGIWSYATPNGTNNNNDVNNWQFGVLDNVYVYPGDCAGEITISPNGSKVFYRSNTNELKFYEYNSGWSKNPTGVTNVGGKIRMTTNDRLFYMGTNSEVWTYYKRPAPGNENWIKSSLRSIGTLSNSFQNYFEVSSTTPTRVITFNKNSGGSTGKLEILEWGTNNGMVNIPCNTTTAQFQKINLKQADISKANIETKQENIIFPNPGSGQFHLVNNLAGTAKLVISKTDGLEVYTNSEIMPGEQMIDLSRLKSGMYIVKISDGQNTQYSKVIIQ